MKTERCKSCGRLFPPNANQLRCNDCRFSAAKPVNWRAIPGYEGRYEISDAGHVLSLIDERRILKASPMADGYMICLSNAYGEARSWLLHRLLLMTFRPTKEFHRLIAIPINKDKFDLRLDNWVWARKEGEHHSRHKLTESDVRIIKARMSQINPPTFKSVGDEYGVTFATIHKIVMGQTWKHVV